MRGLPRIGQRLNQRVALFRITQRLIRQRGVTPLMYQYGETVITQTKEVARGSPERRPDVDSKNRPADGP